MDTFSNKMKRAFSRQGLKKTFTGTGANKVYSSLLCVVVGLLIGLIVMIAFSPKDAFIDFGLLITGGLKYYGVEGVGNILATFAPLLCAGVGVIFAYKTGIFNIGAAGQYCLGAFGAIVFALKLHQHWTVCLIAAMVFGAIWACIPALLKVFCRVNEVISGIMLNWIGLFFVNYSLQTYLIDIVNKGNSFKTYAIKPEFKEGTGELISGWGPAMLPDFGGRGLLGDTFSIAFIIAIIVAVVAFIVMEKTTFGFQLKASGYNRHATKYAGINAKKNCILTMAISGAMIGLGAGLFYLSGIEEWSATISTALPQVPWNGIIIAFIAQMNPIGGIFSAALLAILSTGATATTQSVFPKEISDLITSLIVYLSGLTAVTMRFFPWIKKKFSRKKVSEEEKPLIVSTGEGGK